MKKQFKTSTDTVTIWQVRLFGHYFTVRETIKPCLMK